MGKEDPPQRLNYFIAEGADVSERACVYPEMRACSVFQGRLNLAYTT